MPSDVGNAVFWKVELQRSVRALHRILAKQPAADLVVVLAEAAEQFDECLYVSERNVEETADENCCEED